MRGSRDNQLQVSIRKIKLSKMQIVATIAALLTIAGCDSSDKFERQMAEFEHGIAREKLGADTDSWIEMRNLSEEWEKVGLIFGYFGDFDECQKAIAGLKKVNYAREYRCIPAQAEK